MTFVTIDDAVLDYDPDNPDPADCTLLPEAADWPDLDPSLIPAFNPSSVNPLQDPDAPYDPALTQDPDSGKIEGYGGPGDSPIPPGEALRSMVDKAKSGVPITPGMCLGYQHNERGVGPLYATAKEACLAIPQQFLHPIHDWSKVPRGVLLYTPEHQYGHVWSSLGAGRTVTTDWPSGRWGVVAGATLLSAWGYDQAFWSPFINDVRCWNPTKPKKPQPPTPPDHGHPWFDKEIRQLARKRQALIKAGRLREARLVHQALEALMRVETKNN